MTQSKMPFAFNLSKLPGQVLAWPKKGNTFSLPSLIKSDSFCCWNYLTSTPSSSWCYSWSVTRPSLGSQSFLISTTNPTPFKKQMPGQSSFLLYIHSFPAFSCQTKTEKSDRTNTDTQDIRLRVFTQGHVTKK